MQPKDASYLWDMIKAARMVQQFTNELSESDYLSDERTQAAVERKIEIIGEAARRISDEFKTQYPEIDWKGIIGMRTVLAHDYASIIEGQMWMVVQAHIPELIKSLEPLLPEEPDKG